MKYRLLSGILMVALLLTAGNGSALGESGEAPAANWKTVGPAAPWNSQFSFSYLPTAGIGASAADVSIADYRLKISRNVKLNDHVTLALGGGYGNKHIDSSASAHLPRDLHAMYVETGVTWLINDRSFMSLKAFPGIYSDFQEINGDDVRVPFLALGGYTFDNGLSLVGGFVYRFGYHSGKYIPALGVSYQPNQDWKLDLVWPRPALTRTVSPRLQLYIAGDFASDEYELKDHAFGAKALKYSDYKAMGGASYILFPDVRISASAGYAFARQFMFYDGNRPDLRMDNAPFFKVALDVGW